ncbi:type I-F CRISPR-associated protein Csy3 [Photobacterium kishitanii]|uniref:type I-F CRISPR-associated protein Csy3 n=1 Tax=Photobacterium kishitanii TaxID=318456 RepID=UPI00071AED9F|nr:type I-F CRISPR-associated protein Csy3 [Photobacterium kishitanii]
MKIPISLAYERSIHPSDVCFFTIWPNGNKAPLSFMSRTALGQMETASLAYDTKGKPKKTVTPEALAQGNPHQMDFCSVPFGAEHIECIFSVSFSSELRKPYKCSEPEVKNTLIELVKLYESKIGWDELAGRFLTNICQGKWLWKNTKKAYQLNIEIKPWPWKNNPVLFEDIRTNYSTYSDCQSDTKWTELKQLIINAFSSKDGLAIFEIKAQLTLPTNAAIYPSQAFIEKNQKEKKHQSSRIFQHTSINGQTSPIIGCYKAGAGIFMIDDWYPNAEEPIRIGRFGVHQQDVTCYRPPSTHQDLFSLLEQSEKYIALLKNRKKIPQKTINELHFLMANLIKGGLFQHKGE